MLRSLTIGKVALVCCVSVALVSLAGCGLSPQLSGLTKVATGQMDKMTGTEILSLAADFAPQVPLNEEQADAIAVFLADNEVKTFDDLQALIEQAQADPTSVQLPEGFEELFEGMDPSDLLPDTNTV